MVAACEQNLSNERTREATRLIGWFCQCHSRAQVAVVTVGCTQSCMSLDVTAFGRGELNSKRTIVGVTDGRRAETSHAHSTRAEAHVGRGARAHTFSRFFGIH